MAQAVLGVDDDRERAFRRAVAISAAVHLLLVGLVWLSPLPRRVTHALPGVVNVTLVAAPPGVAPARPAAKPAPKPAPPKPEAKPKEPKPVPPPEAPKPEVKADKKLLPKDPTRTPKPEPPKPKAVAPPKPREEKLDYADALDELRDELGEEEPAEVADADLLASVKPGPRPPGPPGGGAPGVPISAEEAAWRRRVKIHVTRSWILEPGLKRQPLETEVVVTLDTSGAVLGVDVSRRSGNPWYDESVVRALEKASPLPEPPESGDWPLVFTPQDLL